MKDELEDPRVESALRHFRESVRTWSEEEFAKPRSAARPAGNSLWRLVTNPVAAWAMAGVLVAGGVGVPAGIYHQRQVAAAREAANLEQQKLKAAEAQRQAMLAMNDDELMSHVDSDIAQATPDAMQPLASMMSDEDGR
jgi:uncharacterized protein HemX